LYKKDLTKYLFRCTINGGSGDIIRGGVLWHIF
jgi:hypothetical protein